MNEIFKAQLQSKKGGNLNIKEEPYLYQKIEK
jgi:hypothetical protein